jgi:sulfonate transport system substrate-binding protein
MKTKNMQTKRAVTMRILTTRINHTLPLNKLKFTLAVVSSLLVLGCAPSEEATTATSPSSDAAAQPTTTALAPIRVSGSYWIELSPVLVAANSFYPEKMTVGEGGITTINSGASDLATNAETQLLRETIKNPDLRIIMTVTESFYRLVARRSAGITSLADLKGKRVMLPSNTSANYYLVAMLRTVGLTEADVQILPLPPAQGDKSGMDLMSDALVKGEVDVISIWEPEPDSAIKELGEDGIVFQDRSVYREVFNLHARATDLADPVKRRSIVEFVRSVAKATDALKADPTPYWPHVSDITKFSVEEVAAGWPEMEFPVHIIPDMLDVLVDEEPWIAQQQKREPRTREELAKFIDGSVVEEALAGK